MTAWFPFVKAVCLNCDKAVPPGLCASAAFEWMLNHLMGLGPHANSVFHEKCTGLDYNHCCLYGRHRTYWTMKMWMC
eukprot:3425392-Rhodomonas_salina.1